MSGKNSRTLTINLPDGSQREFTNENFTVTFSPAPAEFNPDGLEKSESAAEDLPPNCPQCPKCFSFGVTEDPIAPGKLLCHECGERFQPVTKPGASL